MNFNLLKATILGFILLPLTFSAVEDGIGSNGNNASNAGRFFKPTDSTMKKILKGTALVVGSIVGAAGLGFVVGYSGKKGVNVANRVPMPGEANNDDNTMTTAQAGARGGRQRAA